MGVQIYAEAERNANEFIRFAIPMHNSISGKAGYAQNFRNFTILDKIYLKGQQHETA